MIYEPWLRNSCDYASRHPKPLPNLKKLTKVDKEELGVKDEVEGSTFEVNRVIIENEDNVVTREDIVEQTSADSDLSVVLKDVCEGRMSEKTKKNSYGNSFEELSPYNGILLKGARIVVPPTLIEKILQLSHESHDLGTTKTIP